MKTLEQIRNDNRKYDLLLAGMEDKPVNIPSPFKENEKQVYDNFIKPVSRRVVLRNNDKINK